jgi:uncharacterized ion transporter superfamily protein YfcC
MTEKNAFSLMTNTKTLDTILHATEQLITGASAAGFAVAAMLVNVPLAFLILSSSGHAALAMPRLAPLAETVEQTGGSAVVSRGRAFPIKLGFRWCSGEKL